MNTQISIFFFKQMGGRKDKGATKLYSPYSFYECRGDTIEAREFEVKRYPFDVEAWKTWKA